MFMLFNEIILKISEEITNHDKINFTMTCKKMNQIKYKMIYCEKINIKKIKKLSYFDNFNNIKIRDLASRYPKYVTHLTFGWEFNQEIKDDIPVTVTHLTFGLLFDQKIKDNIPASVTHLQFGTYFDKSLDDIPLSVKEIMISYCYSKKIKNDIIANKIKRY